MLLVNKFCSHLKYYNITHDMPDLVFKKMKHKKTYIYINYIYVQQIESETEVKIPILNMGIACLI